MSGQCQSATNCHAAQLDSLILAADEPLCGVRASPPCAALDRPTDEDRVVRGAAGLTREGRLTHARS
jgi:hypothetical protein